MTNIFKLIILLTMLSIPAFAFEDTGAAGLPGEYLYDLGSSARGIGLGLAQVGLTGSANAIYANPAGIADLWWQEASITYIPLFSGAQFINLSYGYPVKDKYVVGVSLARLTFGDAEKTNDLGETIGTFSDQQSALIVGIAKKITPKFSAGTSIKLVMQDLDTYSARGVGLDMGITYTSSWRDTWALSLINAVPPKLGPDKFPLVAKAGFLHSIIKNKLSLSFDYSAVDFMSSDAAPALLAGGLEFYLKDWIALRAGMNQKQYSFGFGILTKKVDFDYAFIYHPLNIYHAVTINVRYGFEPTQAELAVEKKQEEFKEEKEKYEEEQQAVREQMAKEKADLKLQMRLTTQFMKAREQYEAGDYLDAKTALEGILKLDGTNEDARNLLGEILARLDAGTITKRMRDAKIAYDDAKYDESIRSVEYILKIKPDYQPAIIMGYLIRAQVFIDSKKYREAKNELMEIMKIDPNNNEASGLLKRLQTIIEIYDQK